MDTSGQPWPQSSGPLSQVLDPLGSRNLELESERLEAGATAWFSAYPAKGVLPSAELEEEAAASPGPP